MAESAFELVGEETESAFELVPTKRPSNVIKQGIAGVSDIATGIPAVLGLAGAALETLAKYPINDQGFVDTFMGSMSSGLDSWLLKKGVAGREATNKFLGIKDPVSTEDQAARLLTSMLIPVPAGFLGGVAAKGARGLAGKAATFLTPAVRMGPAGNKLNRQFATRAGVQLGVGAALEQGIRGAMDHPELPLIFSKQAITGEAPTIPVAEEAPLPDALPISDAPMEGERELMGGAGDDLLIGGAAEDSLFELVPVPDTDVPSDSAFELVPETSGTAAATVIEDSEIERLREADAKSERANNSSSAKELGMWAAMILAGGAATRYAFVRSAKKLQEHAPFGVSKNDAGAIERLATQLRDAPENKRQGILASAAADGLRFVGEESIDKAWALSNTLRRMEFDEDTISKLVSNSHVDVRGMGTVVAQTGKFGQDTGIIIPALDDLDLEFAAFRDDTVTHAGVTVSKKQAFNEGVVAATELNQRRNASTARSIWSKHIDDPELKAKVDLARSDTQVRNLMDKVGKVFDGHLQYHVKRGTITAEDAIKFKAKYANTDGSNGYLPLYDARPRDFYSQMKRFLGLHSKTADDLDVQGTFHQSPFKQRGRGEGMMPLGPLAALRTYNIHSIEHANTAGFQHQAASHLAGVQFKPTPSGGTSVTRFRVVNGKMVEAKVGQMPNTGRETRFIGLGKVGDDIDDTRIKIHGDDETINARFGEQKADGYSVEDLRGKVANPDEILVVHQGGELRVFHVPDPALRAVMDINPQLSAGLHFMNHWKSLMTKGTTGVFSMFGLTGHVFGAQQVASTTFAREGAKAAWKSIGQGAKGTFQLSRVLMSKEISDFLAHRIASNTGIAKSYPQWAGKQQAKFQRIFENALINDVRRESGQLNTGWQSDQFSTSLNDFAQSSAGGMFGNAFPASMHLMWRLWKRWNTASHEGPAFGAMMKREGEILLRNGGKSLTSQQTRDIADYGKTLGSNMRKIGASKYAKIFGASIPFSAPMIQSWNALGAAAKKNPGRFLLGASTLIGLPTVMEMTYVEGLDRTGMTFNDGTRDWTYGDYYWNGFTTQQRADNFIMFIPGKPPWEAVILPVSPEWGLFRGVVMETMNALFDFSNKGTGGIAGVGRDQFWASLARVTDVPVPPLVAAALSSQGIDLRFAVSVEKSDDPDDPGTSLSFMRTPALGKGERVSRRPGMTKFVGDTIDINTASMIQDVFGAAGTMYVKVHEAVHAGATIGEDPGAGRAALMGIQAFGDGMLRQARYGQPIFGKALRPSDNDEIAKSVFQKRRGLTSLSADMRNFMGGGAVNIDGRSNIGNTIMLPDDPITRKLATSARGILTTIGKLDKNISDLRRKRTIMGNATNLGSVRERNAKIDGITLEIQGYKAQQSAMLVEYERQMSGSLSKLLDRDVKVDFSDHKPRANFPGSTLRGLQKLLPTSQ